MFLTTGFDKIIALDERWLLAVNGAWSPFLDAIMKPLSAIAIWFPLYLLLAVACFFKRFYSTQCGGYALRKPIKDNKFWLAGVTAVAICILGYLLCDWGSNLVKDLVARPRPGYNPATAAGRFPTGTGSPYGFFSAHAANTMCYALLVSGILGRRWLRLCLVVWSLLVSYSRIYLGCHFPCDVAVGLIYGICVAILLNRLYKFAIRKIQEKYPAADGK
ncbi:MAG: phosphatase PAP2 family protein [Bacteroidales bacterium]|nr:phosphatase PAP2 family protein [Bacteroidales bacterium]